MAMLRRLARAVMAWAADDPVPDAYRRFPRWWWSNARTKRWYEARTAARFGSAVSPPLERKLELVPQPLPEFVPPYSPPKPGPELRAELLHTVPVVRPLWRDKRTGSPRYAPEDVAVVVGGRPLE